MGIGTLIARHRDRPPVRWANGAGTTVELVSPQESAILTPGLPRWRLSVASLERAAPFSPLPGRHRRFLPVGGDVVLTVDGVRTPVQAGTVCEFDGGATVDLVDLPTPCHAVNLMVERAGEPAPPLPRLWSPTSGSPAPAGETLAVALESAGDVGPFDLLRCSEADAWTAARAGTWALLVLS